MALGSIVEGPDRVQLASLFSQALPNLHSLTSDQNSKICEITAWVLGRLCEFHAEILTRDELSVSNII